MDKQVFKDWRVVTRYIKQGETVDFLVVNYKNGEKKKLSEFKEDCSFKNCRPDGNLGLYFYEGKLSTIPTVDVDSEKLISKTNCIAFAHLYLDGTIVGVRCIDYKGDIQNYSLKNFQDCQTLQRIGNAKRWNRDGKTGIIPVKGTYDKIYLRRKEQKCS